MKVLLILLDLSFSRSASSKFGSFDAIMSMTKVCRGGSECSALYDATTDMVLSLTSEAKGTDSGTDWHSLLDWFPCLIPTHEYSDPSLWDRKRLQ
jgi:hypothetical protein